VTASLQLKRGAAASVLREGRAPVRDRLTAMLFLTALLHAIVILGLTFTVTHTAKTDSPQLDVLLVTNDVPEAQSNENASYLSTRTQLGNGNTDSPAPSSSPASQGAPNVRIDAGDGNGSDSGDQAQDKSLLSSSAPTSDIRYVGAKANPGGAQALPQFVGDAPGAPRSGHGDAIELMLRGKSNGERWITPDTRASQLAPYLASWKHKVERVGTLNFPMAARNARLSGSPVVEVEITSDGRLRQAKVQRSSGHGALDEAALTILKLASPFDPFPPDMAGEYARLRFAYQWDFIGGTVQSGAVTSSSDTPSRP
jgi:periplasmic protein TonB